MLTPQTLHLCNLNLLSDHCLLEQITYNIGTQILDSVTDFLGNQYTLVASIFYFSLFLFFLNTLWVEDVPIFPAVTFTVPREITPGTLELTLPFLRLSIALTSGSVLKCRVIATIHSAMSFLLSGKPDFFQPW